jgi:RNA polymerase sigma-70 factor (family 1)
LKTFAKRKFADFMGIWPHQHDRNYTDDALVEMLRSNVQDEAALEQIFLRYHVRLFRIANNVLQDDELSKDLVQDIFIDLWNRRATSNIKALSAYLLKAIKFQVLKQLRNGRLREQHLKRMETVQFVNQTEDSINFSELERVLNDNVEQLPPRCREVFMLSRFENMTNKEISERLKISSKTVEVQITKALSFLREHIHGALLTLYAFLIR